jgi:hypothetical protein
MSDLKLGEPIPTAISGIEPVSSAESQEAADPVVRPFERSIGSMTAAYSDRRLSDQLLLFPMKLGLSMARALDGDARQPDRNDEAAADDRHHSIKDVSSSFSLSPLSEAAISF